MLKKNDVITTQIIDIANDGNGVAKYDGLAIFVPMSAIGDVCEIKILKVMSNYCFGKIEKILVTSQDRISSECDKFFQCGGCDFMHISYDSEKEIKRNFVKASFERIGKIKAEVLPVKCCDKIFRYRNKAQFPVGSDDEGKCITGFYAARSHRVVEGNDCLLQPVLLNSIAQSLIKLFNRYNIKAYDELSRKGLIRHIYLRYAEITHQTMLTIVATSKNIDNLDTITKQIVKEYPCITTIVLNINDKNTNVILGKKNIVLYGNGTITDVLCGIKISLSPHSFYQVNRDGAENLYTIFKDLLDLQKDDILLDMYCGAGTIGLSMAGKVKQLVGVEIVPQAIENAIENAKINNISNAEFICSDAKDAAKLLLNNGFRPSAVVLDPARKGCDTETLEAIVSMSPDKIAMISCNPATSARDCRYLCENGYTIKTIQPFDMFPRTKHVECVCLLTRTEV